MPASDGGVRIGLIGDYDARVTAHQAIPRALDLAAAATGIAVEVEWLPTELIGDTAPLDRFDGLWCVPATPYRSEEGALAAIRFAREAPRPFLGTCGGFQHAVLEYARSVLGWSDAAHAENSRDAAQAGAPPVAARQVVSPLACSLVEVSDEVRFVEGSLLARAYGSSSSREGYHCRYGMNPSFERQLTAGPLRGAATDATGEIRGIELDGHPFFVATLFQPERAALRGDSPPLVEAFVRAAREWRRRGVTSHHTGPTNHPGGPAS